MNAKRIVLTFLFCFFVPIVLFAQMGGKRSFDFLNRTYSGRVLALGGVNITASNEDVQMFAQNPALLHENSLGKVAFSQTGFAGAVSSSFLATAFQIKNRNFGTFLNYNNYGKFTATDPTGQNMGNFSASDFVFGISYAHKIEHFSLGITSKIAGTNIDAYSQYGIFADIGGIFQHPNRDLKIGMLFKNVGLPIKKFYENAEYQSPMNVQLGISFKPEKMPLRFSATFHQLFSKSNVYDDPNLNVTIDANGNPISKTVSGFDKFSRFMVLGGEFLLGKSLRLTIGYNFLTRKEMLVTARPGVAGLSFGIAAQLKWLEVSFSQSTHHIGGSMQCFTLILDTKKLKAKKIVVE